MLCASLLVSAFSSYREQLYHAVPCSLHGPMQTQQNSHLHFLQVMCCRGQYRWSVPFFRRPPLPGWLGLTLHPPFFSIVEWHLVHSFVLAEIQLLVSESSLHFCNQRLTIGQQHGR